MQLATDTLRTVPSTQFSPEENTTSQTRYGDYKIVRRNGAVVGFEPAKISIALTKAFIAVNGGQGAASARIREVVSVLTDAVVNALLRRQPGGGTFHIEDIQDQVELALMRSGEHEVARAYVLYREDRTRARQREAQTQTASVVRPPINVTENGITYPLDMTRLAALVHESCEGLGSAVDAELILQGTIKDLYSGVPMAEVRKSLTLSARSLIEKDPAYSYATARLLLHSLRLEAIGEEITQSAMKTRYAEAFPQLIMEGIESELLDERMARYDLARLGAALDVNRDLKFGCRLSTIVIFCM
jgi:ribonucleoside-diphosphate reductase alpha chain